uniref:WAT1-related protein n=1 Tax=Nelumbo nucifera TaxID=4432 RepID=A0A822YII0_NELNU|nr:TPA_asm: hypothetical protein HUJ06_010774 [Nelumbo nucifera]
MGVSKVVMTVYRNIIALILLGPCAYFLDKEARPPLTCSLLVKFFLLGLLGVSVVCFLFAFLIFMVTGLQGFFLLGLCYMSPTFLSALQNSVPAITFAMASALGFEQVNVLRRDGLAKVVGTILSIGGATIITLYKDPPLNFLQHSQRKSVEEYMGLYSTEVKNWALGCLYVLGHCLSWCSWMILQVRMPSSQNTETSIIPNSQRTEALSSLFFPNGSTASAL